MDPNQVLETIKESGVAPTEFWYLSTLILTGILVLFIGILIFFVKGFFKSLQETLDQFSKRMDKFAESMEGLKDMTQLHDWEIKAMKAKLEKPRRQ